MQNEKKNQGMNEWVKEKPVKTKRKLHNQKSQQAVINGPYIFEMPTPRTDNLLLEEPTHSNYVRQASRTDGNGQNKSPERRMHTHVHRRKWCDDPYERIS